MILIYKVVVMCVMLLWYYFVVVYIGFRVYISIFLNIVFEEVNFLFFEVLEILLDYEKKE